MAQYYLIKNNERIGPLDVEKLLENGLTPDTLVWTDGMPDWVKASTLPELTALFAPAQPAAPAPPAQPATPVPPAAPVPPAVAPQAPAQPQAPQYQAPAQPQAPYQAPYQAPAVPVAAGNNQNIFKIILYVLLGLSILGGLINFIGSFSYFGGWFNNPLLGICQLFGSLATIGIGVVSIMRMTKNEKYGFITIGYFAIAFVLNLLGLIIVGSYGGFGALSLILGIAGLAIAVLASIPMDKISDVNCYKDLLKEATTVDYVLLGVYAVCTIISFFALLKYVKLLRGFRL